VAQQKIMHLLSAFRSWVLQSRAVAVNTQALRLHSSAGVFWHRLLCLVMMVHEDLRVNIWCTSTEMECVVTVLHCVGEDRLSICVVRNSPS